MRLAQVILFVKDVPRMQAFYTGAMGLRVIEGSAGEGWLRLDAGACVLALHAVPDAIAATITLEDPPLARSDTPLKPCFHADDVEAAREALEAAGATMRDVRRFDGVTLCDGIDPEGNVFQITSR